MKNELVRQRILYFVFLSVVILLLSISEGLVFCACWDSSKSCSIDGNFLFLSI